MTKKEDGSAGQVGIITKLLEDKKAGDVKVMDVRGMSDLWDYFVVCSGLSVVHVRTLFDHLDDEMSKLGYPPAHKDSGNESKWMVIDFGDILVHIFDAESRQYYAIEKMWGEKEELAAKFIKRMHKTVKAKKEKVKNEKKGRKQDHTKPKR